MRVSFRLVLRATLFFFFYFYSSTLAIGYDLYEKVDKEEDDVKHKSDDFKYTNLQAIKDNSGYDILNTDYLENFYSFTAQYQTRYRFPNLGLDGGPVNIPFYFLPNAIGIKSGFINNELYFLQYDKLNIYECPYPYSVFYFIPGIRYSNFHFSYNFQLKKRLNLGVSFKHKSNYKDKPVKNLLNRVNNLNLFIHYHGDRFQSLFSILLGSYNVNESGGSKITSSKLEDYFINPTNRLKYNELVNEGKIGVISLYNQFKINELITVYHELLREKDKNSLIYGASKKEYDKKKDDTDVSDITNMISWSNEAGFKISTEGQYFYRFYGRVRAIKHNYLHLNNKESVYNEYYLGTKLRYSSKDNNYKIDAGGEYLFGGLFNITTSYSSKYLVTGFRIAKYRPYLLHQSYSSNYNAKRANSDYNDQKWENNFSDILGRSLDIKLNLDFKSIKLNPYLKITKVNKPIIFSQVSNINYLDKKRPSVISIKPNQLDIVFNYLSPGLQAKLKFFKYINFDLDASISFFSGDDVFILKNMYNNSRYTFFSKIYYGAHMYNNALYLESGIKIHFNKCHDDYDPATQQFFIQNYFNVYMYPVIDLFMAFKANNFAFFVTLKNINKGILAPGYLAAPFYIGEDRAIYFGFLWSFTD